MSLSSAIILCFALIARSPFAQASKGDEVCAIQHPIISAIFLGLVEYLFDGTNGFFSLLAGII